MTDDENTDEITDKFPLTKLEWRLLQRFLAIAPAQRVTLDARQFVSDRDGLFAAAEQMVLIFEVPVPTTLRPTDSKQRPERVRVDAIRLSPQHGLELIYAWDAVAVSGARKRVLYGVEKITEVTHVEQTLR